MLVDWNEGYISVCPLPDLIPVEDKNTYLPSSTWGYIRGDISEQKDLMKLLTTIESGLSPAQISLLIDADERIDEVKADVILLEQKHNTEISDINTVLDTKVNITDVYTKSEIDSKNYLTEHQSLAGYATENWVKDQKYLTEHQSLAGLATEEWVVEQGYLTEHQSLAGYATENWVYNKGYISQETDPVWSAEKHKYALKSEIPSFSGYAKESWVSEQLTAKANVVDIYSKIEIDGKNYITESQLNTELLAYAKVGEVWTKDDMANGSLTKEDLKIDGYATEDWVRNQKYLTEHQSLDNYYTKDEVDTAIENVEVDLSEYYTKSEVDTAIENVEVDLTGYATEVYVDTGLEKKVDYDKIWTGTKEEWESMSVKQQESYIIAMVEI